MATCGVGGPVYTYNGILSGLMDKYYPNVKLIVVPSACYVENAKLIYDNSVEAANISPMIAYQLYKGEGLYAGKAVPDLRAIVPTHGSPIQLVVRADSPYQSLADLKGKKIGTYTVGAQAYINLGYLLDTYGMKYGKDVQEIQMGVTDMVTQMKDGTIEFMFVGAGYPDARIMDLATDRKIRLLPFPKANFDKLMEGRPAGAYTYKPLPANTYPNVTTAVDCVVENNLIVTRAPTPDYVVYELVKVLFENLGEARAQHRLFTETSEKDLVAPIPLHPGAEKYYKEKGWIK